MPTKTSSPMSNTEALAEAIEEAGGQSALARRISREPGAVKQGHVWTWLNRDKQAPAEHCPAIERETRVRCEDLRSELTWTRDRSGQVTGYHVPVPSAEQGEAA